MTAFEHVAVLISIVIGLSITQLLVSVHRLVQARGRVRLYWLPLAWVGLLFVALVEWWWGIYGLRAEMGAWNFFYFLFILANPVSLFLASAFVLPNIEAGQLFDLKDYYFRWRGWLFGAVAVGPAIDAIRHGLDRGWSDVGAWSNAVGAALLTSMAVSRRESFHAAVTLAVAGLFLFFIIQAAIHLH